MELIQKSFGSKKEYRILADRLFITTANFNKSTEYSIKFEELGFDLVREKTKSIIWLIPLYLIFTGLELYVLIDEYNKGVRFPQLLFWIFGFLGFGAGAIYSFFQKTETVYLTGGNTVLKLDALNPKPEIVDAFIKTLHTRIKSYLKHKYGVVDTALSKEASIQNFKWLREISALNEAEYEELVYELNTKNLL